MRAVYLFPLAYLSGVHGFALYAPVMALVFAAVGLLHYRAAIAARCVQAARALHALVC